MTAKSNRNKIYFAYMGRCSGHKTVAEAKKCLNAAEDYVVAIENGQIRAITKSGQYILSSSLADLRISSGGSSRLGSQ